MCVIWNDFVFVALFHLQLFPHSPFSLPAISELVAGSYGIEARYPFLDPEVVQEFLWLTAEVKNSVYKRPVRDLLHFLECPLDEGKKVGFTANPDQLSPEQKRRQQQHHQSREEEEDSPAPPPPSCGDRFDAAGMADYGVTKLGNLTHAVRMLEAVVELEPGCPHFRVELAKLLAGRVGGDGGEGGAGRRAGRLLDEAEADFVRAESTGGPTAAAAPADAAATPKISSGFVHSSGGLTPLKVVTYATAATKGLDFLLKTADNGRVSVDILGIGDGRKTR